MRHIVLIISATLLTSCAQQEAPSLLEQGQQCWNNAKDRFTAANPDSPAAWYQPDNYTPTPKDLRSKAKVTPVEKQDLAYLIKAYQDCYFPPLQLTGDHKYDDYLRRTDMDKYTTGNAKYADLIRTVYEGNILSLFDIILYANGRLTRGEYYRRYAATQSQFEDPAQKDLAALRAEEPVEGRYPTSANRH